MSTRCIPRRWLPSERWLQCWRMKSTIRCRAFLRIPSFYGLERDDDLLRQRLLKESVHELGHTLDLHHCEDYRCVMASSHAVEWIDLREVTFCALCQSKL